MKAGDGISLGSCGDGALALVRELLWPQLEPAATLARPVCEPWAKSIAEELARRKRCGAAAADAADAPGASAVLRVPHGLSEEQIFTCCFLLGKFLEAMPTFEATARARSSPDDPPERYVEARQLAANMVLALRDAMRGIPRRGTAAPHRLAPRFVN